MMVQVVNDASAINNLNHHEYLHKKSDEVKTLRKKLNEIRQLISDYIADKIGNDVSSVFSNK
jgi:hypothetical protein